MVQIREFLRASDRGLSDSDMRRMDWRTLSEFQRDIEVAHQDELTIARLFATILENRFGRKVHLALSGCDMSGKYLDIHEVSTAADIRINGQPIEIKFDRTGIDQKRIFHLKKHQVESYIRQKAKILFVKGWGTERPFFTMIDPEQVEGLAEALVFHLRWNEMAYRLNCDRLKWAEFRV